jgi:hypothetical protein
MITIVCLRLSKLCQHKNETSINKNKKHFLLLQRPIYITPQYLLHNIYPTNKSSTTSYTHNVFSCMEIANVSLAVPLYSLFRVVLWDIKLCLQQRIKLESVYTNSR